MPSPKPVDASVVIVTRDRRDVLRGVLDSLLRQSVAAELLVLDDASQDETFEMLSRDFPGVSAHRREEPLGCVARRTEAAHLARGKVIVFLDDDIEIDSTQVLERTLADIDHPGVGAVAMPFMESWDTPRVRFRAPNTNGVFATFRFAAGASAVRRDLFLSLGGFRPELVVQGEETDFCLRLLARGFVVRLGTADPLLHLRLPPDDLAAKAMYGARNELLYAWRNVPMPYLPVRLTKVVARALMVGASSRHPLSAISGLWQGFKRTVGAPDQRRPVERGVYRLAHELKKREAIPFEEIEPQLRSATD